MKGLCVACEKCCENPEVFESIDEKDLLTWFKDETRDNILDRLAVMAENSLNRGGLKFIKASLATCKNHPSEAFKRDRLNVGFMILR